ncbi:glyoxalase [Arsenicitalea aurantiaca]|uniref:Glyoxalase n=1 Tax=Arsenicitalea aurantiaca TaxID=1783274 RepID=A0A433XLR6_9HYPH|nr:VOC family protein [Arsenicitalea aurantiaca]RUT35022.1 glyoxalase [Arsenicitalea aurantiaca]
MQLTGYYPVIQTSDVAGVADFYSRHFGFAPSFETDWYVHLKAISDPRVELAILRTGHVTVPEAGRGATTHLILNFEVSDAAAEYRRLTEAGLEMLLALRDEAFGQRHFITRDPAGTMIDVIEPIPTSGEFAGL